MSGWLIDTFIYTGVLIGAVLVLRRPVGRLFGPQIAYALWALPFLRLLLPPIVLPARFAPEAAPAAVPVAQVVDIQPVAETPWVEAASTAPVETAPVAFTPVEAPAAAAVPAWDWTLLGEIALSVWAGGALAFLAWRIVTYRKMRRELLVEARSVGDIGKIRLVETPALAAPVAFGVLDKVIALPPLFMAQPDLAARDLAIEHELAHHRGQDLLANFAAQALLAVHFFNPLAWYGWRAMRRDQEAACDARVLAGRGRDDRLRYAALIAGTAAGPRLSLAAPLSCPLIGERSIVHRLRSLAMSDLSTRRRWLGRALVAAGAFALPLTASISYSAAAQSSADPTAPEAEAAPLAADAPEAPRAPFPVMDHFLLEREGEGDEVKSLGRRLEFDRGEWAAPQPMPMPAFDYPQWDDPEFEKKIEQFGHDMEKWGKDWEKWGEKWGEQWAEHAREQAEQARAHAQHGSAQALAWADAARFAPEVVHSCDQGERATADDGRPRVVICQRDIERIARSSLRFARNSIAGNPEISDEVRREVLADLDEEIERIEREGD